MLAGLASIDKWRRVAVGGACDQLENATRSRRPVWSLVGSFVRVSTWRLGVVLETVQVASTDASDVCSSTVKGGPTFASYRPGGGSDTGIENPSSTTSWSA